VSDDPVLDRLREQISEADRTIVEAMNRRLELVAEVKAHKESQGIAFLDPAREQWMLDDLTRANRGPLSTEGLCELFAAILDLSKREVSQPPSG
jgi:chorismate mutase